LEVIERGDLLGSHTGSARAQNLKLFDAPKPRTFVGYYESTASQSAMLIATARVSGN
jgi:hypothetical protein